MRIRSILFFITLLTNTFLVQAGPAKTASDKPVKIGLLMDTLKEERWQKDRDLMVEHAKKVGAEILVQAANGNDSLQYSQAENLLTQGVDVLIVVPHNGVTAGAIVNLAHKAGKKVVSYDRLIQNSDVDLYVSFDNVQVGRIQGEYIVKKAPQGNYIWIGGAPTDPNAAMLREGQFEFLTPAVKRGDIKIVAEQWAKEWQASEALKHTENALVANKNNVTAVLASNDGTAGGVISALKQQGLAGKVIVTGQDADLPACKRIAEGTQTMTVYKPIKQLAATSVDSAILLAKGTPLQGVNTAVSNGSKKEIPAILLKPIAVDASNMKDTIIKDGFHTMVAVYGK
jgi:D-xylose transport system substrate-binding protein